jgi:TetR/AcrR family acrAB operon transcriptional repressor
LRRTKADAARTRTSIMDAALECFDRHGLASSTLDQIAAEAKVTKGAIYYHFAGKAEIFHELREQVSLPLLDEADTELLQSRDMPALERVEKLLLGILDSLENNRRKRQALTVMQFKCEYVDDIAAELAGAARNHKRLLTAFEGAYREARKAGQLGKGLSPEVAACETLMFMSGMVRMWLLHGNRNDVRKNARSAVQAHVRSKQAAGSPRN